MILRFFVILLGTMSLGSNAWSDAVDGWIEGKLKYLSLEEKIGQMIMVNLSGETLDTQGASAMDQGFFGSLILFENNIKSQTQLSSLVRQLQTRARMRSGIPLIIAIDQEGGIVNRLGHLIDPLRSQYSPRVLGRAFQFREEPTKRALRRFYRYIAVEMKKWGVNMNLAPVLDLADDPKAYIFNRSYGNNPKIVSSIALDMSQAMQSYGIMVTGKHFPNLGNSKVDSHMGLPVLYRTLQELMKHELKPYFTLKNTLDAVMLGHILVPSIDRRFPASLSAKTTQILRKKIGFDGVLMTDDLKMGAITKNFTLEQVTMMTVQADVDILLVASQRDMHQKVFDILLDAVKSDKISKRRIDQSVRRILQLKRRYLFESPGPDSFQVSAHSLNEIL